MKTALHPVYQDSRPADWSPDWCPTPTVGTRRRPERPTYGGHAAEVAEALGTPYLPAQRLIADVALEYDPDTGLLFYDTVVVILPRQSGKTTVVVLSFVVVRGIMWPNQAMVYTAQDRNHARDKFEEDFVPRLKAAPGFTEGKDFTVRLANGSERVRFENGSYLYISASGSHSGHSKTLDVPVVDEAWFHQNTDVDSGFRVPMITRKRVVPGAQQLIASAAGVEGEQVYLDSKLEIGRQAVAEDSGRGVAIFDYSCPRDMDPFEPANWWHFMPALGHTVSEADIANEVSAMTREDWLRAYASWPKPAVVRGECGVNLDVWARRGRADAGEWSSDLVLAVAVEAESSAASVAVAGWLDADTRQVELIDHRPGTGWVARRIGELVAKRDDIVAVAVDRSGPGGYLIGELEALEDLDVEVRSVTGTEFVNYCRSFVEALEGAGEEPAVVHVRDEALDAAAAGSERKATGERWRWNRRVVGVDVAPLEAVTLAAGVLAALVDDGYSDAYSEDGGGLDEDW